MNTNNILRALLGVLIAAFLAVIVFSLRDTSAREGAKAPPFSITTEQGRRITATSFDGKLLVLNFWATWCGPCVQEIPSLNAFQKRFAKQGVVVVAISVDTDAAKYKRFLSRIPVAFQTARDAKADVSTEYGTFVFPETYIIKNGKVMRKFANAENWTDDDMTQYVQSLL